MLFKALSGKSKEEILFGDHFPQEIRPGLSERMEAIAQGAYRDKPESAISGSGYVVNCLEAALWSFHRTDDFRDAVLMAVNLGDDADTTGAVCGQLAGAFYGEAAIPESWRLRLVQRDSIGLLAERLLKHA